ncbi:ribonuclease III [Patescibacteria group bacterium]|nr:MAG: ribonuclease III [Patescibacteria group bacterium]
MKDLAELQKNLGVEFKDEKLLLQAVVHRSYLNEHPDFGTGHNERLEFLGDAVIELVVTEYLYEHYPNPEGELTNWRAALVNAIMLAGIAKELGVEDFLLLSRGEAKDKGSKARMYILANAFESVVGSMYLDGGYEVCQRFIGEKVLSRLPYILEHRLYLDPKSRFQEAAQEKIGLTPTYRVLDEVGPDHAKVFTVGVYIGEEQISLGKGTSKQEAQVAAAEQALEKKGW